MSIFSRLHSIEEKSATDAAAMDYYPAAYLTPPLRRAAARHTGLRDIFDFLARPGSASLYRSHAIVYREQMSIVSRHYFA